MAVVVMVMALVVVEHIIQAVARLVHPVRYLLNGWRNYNEIRTDN
jgi:hypothetical protein